MARRSSRSSAVSVFGGRYHRTLGRFVNDDNEVVAKKFLLGTDKEAAEAANRLRERLWEEVVAEHDGTVRWMHELGGRLGDGNLISGDRGYGRLRRLDCGPIWRDESLMIADVIREGQREAAVQVGPDADRPDAYVERVANLRRIYSVVAFVPASPELYAAGQQLLAGEAQRVAADAQEQVQRLSSLAEAPLPAPEGPTLYQALDAYGKSAIEKNPRESGQREATCAKRLKDSHPDIPLEQFGISAMEAMAAYWARRPLAKKTGRPVALDTIRNHLKVARRFIKWLHRTDAFRWNKPVDAEQALRVNVTRLRNDAEMAALGRGVAVWNLDELAILYRYATDRERLLILLGLNCGFAQSELCTLRRDEILRHPQGATIKRIRRKSQVYGEFVAWPQTLAALDWFDAQRGQGAGRGKSEVDEYVLLTREGRLYDRQRIANLWNRLLDRVQADYPTFRRLPFKHLRKTAGHLVRQHSDGEISGVFLSHGRAVASDGLADVYSNRPFDKVAAALALVHRDLQPLLDAVSDAFTKKVSSSPNISRGTIEMIRKLHAEGLSQAQIAAATGLTAQTIRRWTGRCQALDAQTEP